MAQDFVGSNNIPLLYPAGQFGTRYALVCSPDWVLHHSFIRLQGGKDSASARYIFTHLDPMTRMVFPEEDDQLLNYLDEDGELVQPDYYMPIIPMVLVNGTLQSSSSTRKPNSLS